MISLGVYYIAFPSFIDHAFISYTTESFVSINEIIPELVEYIKGHLILINSFVTSYDLLREIDDRFYSVLPLFFLHPLLIRSSKYILSILTQSVKILSAIEAGDKTEIFNNLCNDVVSASLAIIKHDSKIHYTQERTHLLLLIVQGELIDKGNIEIQNAFNNVIQFENPNLKNIFDIVNATENFDNLYDDLIIQAFEALANEITEKTDNIRISAMRLMTKLLEKDSNRFSSIFLCDDSIEYIQDIIKIINNGTANEFKHAGKLLSFIMQRFPQLFAKEIWWTTNDPNDVNLPNAIDKFILYKQSRTQSFFLGLECIASFMRIENIDSQPFIEALVNIGIKEKMEEYIDDDPDDELAPFVYEDLFGE
ncbi:hypothetical protein TVAG_308300 [Trichomonas vaginalis G3]|uniref:Uncharacterized protein n=1 Tax=Trichomonas vaginalis (strain ATCC PRA-98 / G3) TaxID=412133 RepID=A2EGM9_TRIV3|nr:armadillo (ARM) repeat-containing protein family [Trichomonas vaginalis G3]EAY08224.1 hypothetical protein TVAG_308300 [Trichomonas vaginalis G3]KAI5519727.1 armadillo (ARM) repeat-containing protein family [Trichomonas vaginalis G3]|eukprot:XP_001320447.1 hypothetical protein [Trichomonas vaginalis G3]